MAPYVLSLTYMLSHVIHQGNDWSRCKGQVEPEAGPFKGEQRERHLAWLACLKVM